MNARRAKTHPADFLFTSHGSITTLTPVSAGARRVVRERFTHPETQFFGRAVVIEPRYVEAILTDLRDDGYTIS